jgi:hypothetical protein
MRFTWIAIIASSLTGIGAIFGLHYGDLEVDKGAEVPAGTYFKV